MFMLQFTAWQKYDWMFCTMITCTNEYIRIEMQVLYSKDQSGLYLFCFSIIQKICNQLKYGRLYYLVLVYRIWLHHVWNMTVRKILPLALTQSWALFWLFPWLFWIFRYIWLLFLVECYIWRLLESLAGQHTPFPLDISTKKRPE